MIRGNDTWSVDFYMSTDLISSMFSLVTSHYSFTFFTFGTGAVPGLPQGSTAVGLQGCTIDVDLTAAVDDFQPAGTLSRL